VIPSDGRVARLFRQYLMLRELTGIDSFQFSPMELWLRLEAQEDIRSRYRFDTFRATAAAGSTVMGEPDAQKVLL